MSADRILTETMRKTPDPADATGLTGSRKIRKIKSYMYVAVKSPYDEAALLNSHAFPIHVAIYLPRAEIFLGYGFKPCGHVLVDTAK